MNSWDWIVEFFFKKYEGYEIMSFGNFFSEKKKLLFYLKGKMFKRFSGSVMYLLYVLWLFLLVYKLKLKLNLGYIEIFLFNISKIIYSENLI